MDFDWWLCIAFSLPAVIAAVLVWPNAAVSIGLTAYGAIPFGITAWIHRTSEPEGGAR